ncbi:Hypothetical Protein FCC1311_004372 [Hondaea fermentalgiana]|uniref:Uncharacterized protein n=1 Tax=Hondaea fermentalgiana TaxID=2315210 RepID=A0A2R5G1N7_9STRA|nr:Hypothetical Protein FCC1311_004372 [Hondaea fermentalgiana]|eukprot:GBG24219.1 Hypothetical Protein FCC1311_004372 [Hondaea fermentalgiana]
MMRGALLLALAVVAAPQVARAEYLTCAAGEHLCCDAVDSSVTEYTLTDGVIKGCSDTYQNTDSSDSSTYCVRMVSYVTGTMATASSCWCGTSTDSWDSGTWNYDCDADKCMESASENVGYTPGLCDLGEAIEDAAEGFFAAMGAIAIVIIIVGVLAIVGIIAAIYCCCCKKSHQVVVVQGGGK